MRLIALFPAAILLVWQLAGGGSPGVDAVYEH